MDRVKRNARIGAIVKILTEKPNHIYTLNYFSELFSTAKSTVSEDITIVKDIFRSFRLGTLETVTGAAGGVKYLPQPDESQILDFVQSLCRQLSQPHRILPGGLLYMSDILFMPKVAQQAGEIIASQFADKLPDFVITVETKGIPVAMMTARALDCPVVIARRDNKATEGSVVTINYVSASSKRIQTMSLSKRAVKDGQKALIVDDFMKGGGTARGMMDLLKEFNIDIIGVGVVIATQVPGEKMIRDYRSLMVLNHVDEDAKTIKIEPAPWILNSDASMY